MIFPDVPLEVWLERHPKLKVLEATCDGCGQTRKTTVPFVAKDMVGLQSPKCPCGKARTKSSTMVLSGKLNEEWLDLLHGGIDEI